ASVHDTGNGNTALVASDQLAFSITVRTSNQAPVWVSSTDVSVPAHGTLSAQLVALDPDNDQVTYTADGLPPGAKLDPVTGILTWAVGNAPVGIYSGITVTATDG